MPRRPKKVYDHLWERLRLVVLERDRYLCYNPDDEAPHRATNVDHIIPVEEAPHLRLVPENCRASCNKHNYGRANRRAAELIRISRAVGNVRQW